MKWPLYQPYYPALVRLLRGVIYAEEEKYWSLVQNHRHDIEDYFLKVGLLLTIVDGEDFAYLRTIPADEMPETYSGMPKLTRSQKLSFQVTLICILLRKRYTRHQENVGNLEPPTVTLDDLFEEYHSIPEVARRDELKGRQHFETQFKKVHRELRVVSESELDEGTWRILPSITALVTFEFIEKFEEATAPKAKVPQADMESEEEE